MSRRRCSPPAPTRPAIRALLSVDRCDEALRELRYAQRAWGDTPAVQATIAYVNRKKRMTESNTSEKFNLLRGSITQMRRAYPQFMAAGGQDLPRDILLHIFPIAYWDLIRKYSAQNNLDPYLIAALMAQESTFVPGIRSHANACGLLQLWPPTARRLARQMKVPYSTRLIGPTCGWERSETRRPESRIRRRPPRARELQRRRHRRPALDRLNVPG